MTGALSPDNEVVQMPFDWHFICALRTFLSRPTCMRWTSIRNAMPGSKASMS